MYIEWDIIRYFLQKRRRTVADKTAKVEEEVDQNEPERKQRDGKVIENGWLAEEVVTMIDDSPEEDDHRWKSSNNDKESAI